MNTVHHQDIKYVQETLEETSKLKNFYDGVVPYQFRYEFLHKNGTINYLAGDLLTYIVTWYLPKKDTVPYEKRFSGELLNVCYKDLSQKFNASDQALRRALKVLEERGAIEKELRKIVRTINGSRTVMPNSQYIKVNPKVVAKILKKHEQNKFGHTGPRKGRCKQSDQYRVNFKSDIVVRMTDKTDHLGRGTLTHVTTPTCENTVKNCGKSIDNEREDHPCNHHKGGPITSNRTITSIYSPLRIQEGSPQGGNAQKVINFREEYMREKEKRKRPRKRFSEDAILTSEWRDIALGIGIHPTYVDYLFDNFRHYWVYECVPAKSLKADWKRAWSNWCIKDLPRCRYEAPDFVKKESQKLRDADFVVEVSEEDPVINTFKENLLSLWGKWRFHSFFEGSFVSRQEDRITITLKKSSVPQLIMAQDENDILSSTKCDVYIKNCTQGEMEILQPKAKNHMNRGDVGEMLSSVLANLRVSEEKKEEKQDLPRRKISISAEERYAALRRL